MYDPSFHPKNLHNEFNSGDFSRNRALMAPAVRNEVIAHATARASSTYTNLRLRKRKINKSDVYKLEYLSDELVLRKISRNIRRITSVRQTNRASIIKCLRRLVSEGVPFRVYKIDIKKFYESISSELFLAPITADSAFPPATTKLLSSFFDSTTNIGIKGLPRGLALSAVLSEYIMRGFDNGVAKFEGVFFYSRFVDDMVFITKGDEDPKDFLRAINQMLPKGLITNPAKTKHYSFKAFDKSNNAPDLEGKFDFLGYVFEIGKAKRNKDNRISRHVNIDIADSKVRRIKTRICISLLQYCKDSNYESLIARIRILCGNYNFLDNKKKTLQRAGIFHSYHLIGPEPSAALRELDKFYRAMLLSDKGKICRQLSGRLNRIQRNELLKYSFERGFYDKTYFCMKSHKIVELKRCWSNA